MQSIGSYAPASRLTTASSDIVVDGICSGGGLLIVIVALLLAYLAKSRVRALSGEMRLGTGFRGLTIIQGVAEPIDGDTTAQAFVELLIKQEGTQRISKSGYYIDWRETSREQSERPFIVRTDAGEPVRIETETRVDLIDDLEPGTRIAGKNERQRVARIVRGERVWVRGLVSRTSSSDAGPYRSGDNTNIVLRPPVRGKLLVSSQPILAEDQATRRFHTRFAVLFALIFLAQAVLFYDFRALRSHGVLGEAAVISSRRWITRHKRSETKHYALALEVVGSDIHIEEETSARVLKRCPPGSLVPLTYVPSAPSRHQLGFPNELGISTGREGAGILLLSFPLIVYGIWMLWRRPWWRRQKINDLEDAML